MNPTTSPQPSRFRALILPFIFALACPFSLFLCSCTGPRPAITESTYPATAIDGAFGMKLGSKFNPSDAVMQSTFNGQTGYFFKPEKPFRAFNAYVLFITPKSHRIYGIMAMNIGAATAGPADVDFRILIQALSAKYGAVTKNPKDGNSIYVRRGNRVIVAGIHKGSLAAQYHDTALARLAELEGSSGIGRLIDPSAF